MSSGDSSGVSTGTKTTVRGTVEFPEIVRRALIIPPTGPESGARSLMVSSGQLGRGAPLSSTREQPAISKTLRARSSNGSPDSSSVALSIPMREDFPPARTTPMVSVMAVPCFWFVVIRNRAVRTECVPLNPFAITIQIMLLLPDRRAVFDFFDNEATGFE